MKFRSDFVTNSSSSSFITFNVRNPELFAYLQSLGIQFKNTDAGEFSDNMEVVLPSGETMEFWGIEEADFLPACSENTLAIWVMALLLYEVESVYPAKELDEYSEFTLELIKMLNAAGVINLDMENYEDWDREMLEDQLIESFSKMDKSTESADIEICSGFEGELCFADYVVARNGYELNISIGQDGEEDREDLDGLRVVITGKTELFENRDELREYIEDLGGIVVSSISGNTDLVICNNLDSKSSKMQKAEEFCIPVISEKGFVRRYGDISEFDIDEDNDDIYEELFECTYEGEFYSMFHQYGIGTVARFKPGKERKNHEVSE